MCIRDRHGGRRRDVEAPVVGVAPGEVRRGLGRIDHAEACPVWIEDVDAAGAAAVHVTGGVDLHPVGRAPPFARRLRPELATRERPVGTHVEDTNVLAGGVVDEESPAVEGEAEAVRPVEVVDEEHRPLRVRAGAIDALKGQFLLPLDTEEVGSSIGWIAEVDTAVGRADDVVRAIELLALVVRREGRDAPAGLGAGHLARRVLAREQASLRIPREPVGLVARLPEGRDAVALGPAPEMIPGHITPQEVMLPGMPERTLREEAARGDPLELDAGTDHAGEARVADRDAHFAIRSPGFPATYQSGGSMSSITTHTACDGSLVTSQAVWVVIEDIDP